MTRPTAIEDQATRLAQWLEERPGASPPDNVDPQVLEALWVLRPDLAPAPRVTVDDILASVTAGPFAPGVEPLEAHRRTMAAPVRAGRRSRAGAWWSGAGVLAVAALALVVVQPYLRRDVPEPATERTDAPVAQPEPAVEPPAPVEPPLVAVIAPSPATRASVRPSSPAAADHDRGIPEASSRPASAAPAPQEAAVEEKASFGWPGDAAAPAAGLRTSEDEAARLEGQARSKAVAPAAMSVERTMASPSALDGSRRAMVDATWAKVATRMDAGDRAGALALLTPLLEDPDPSVAQDAALRAAALQLDAGLRTAALATVDRGLARDARATAFRARLLALRGAILEEMGRSAEAAEAYRAAEVIGTP